MERKFRTRVTTWMELSLKNKLITEGFYRDFCEDNEKKDLFLERYNLPRYINFGTAKNTAQLEEIIPEKYRKGKFWIRLMNGNEVNGEKKIYNTSELNLSFEDLMDKVKEDFPVYQVIEFMKSEYAGTIIANSGIIVTESWKGTQANSEDTTIESIFSQKINLNEGGIHFNYSENCRDFEKNLMLNGLKFFVSDLKREKLEQLKLYSEYVFSKDRGYIFIDGSEHKFWTNI